MVMGEGKDHNFKDYHYRHNRQDLQSWAAAMKEPEKYEHEHEEHPCSSIEEASTISNGSSSFTCSSSSSFDTTDDASSSADSPNSSRSSLYDLSDLMSQLPIKRGLSKFYHGKSDSFTSLAKVTSIDDLPKKDKNPYKKKMEERYRSHTLPKAIISKKNSRKKKFCSIIKKELNL